MVVFMYAAIAWAFVGSASDRKRPWTVCSSAVGCTLVPTLRFDEAGVASASLKLYRRSAADCTVASESRTQGGCRMTARDILERAVHSFVPYLHPSGELHDPVFDEPT